MAYKYLSNTEEKPSALIKPTVILVEGEDDGIFLEQLFDSRGEDPTRIQILFIKGISKLWSYLSALTKSPIFVEGSIKGICVIIDADRDFAQTETFARSQFRKSNLAEPASSSIEEKDGVRIGLYILPNSSDNGELEDLIIGTLSHETRIIDAQALLTKHTPPQADFKKRSKRVLQISLALSDTDLCAGIGRGIRNGAFEVNTANFSDLNEFLDRFLAD